MNFLYFGIGIVLLIVGIGLFPLMDSISLRKRDKHGSKHPIDESNYPSSSENRPD
ncbi:hypothetical protein ABE137_03270 [Brevibacillus laterosporus]|uniref:Uncharacterized protein n=2 Tax=Brevibacillus laterosporus TaxID=1465 RepID=A0A075R0G2_BRELA|nr:MULTISPECIES: hypothetical protein [Brevibacillus]AIG26092.1 hypothetical protein BRLA_c017680 [Brevibacillus laterosporus LMG 15441]MCR8964266.1 hypothetical protein [Brevibacillus laterosporus]MCR8995225.1 hypothetical protein [Brevibacillus laterosporus]MCZ0836421.1 hypothetical protein [Brevibacillus halotolerans]WPS87400.1 hypothetical protein SMD22_23465 [Brevibacillus halotolerans]